VRKILLTTFGSYGDLFPYLAIGRELKTRGHEVTIGTSVSYRARVEDAGLGFHPIRPDVSLDNSELLAYVFDQRRGSERVLRLVSSVVRESYEDTLAAARDADAIMTHPITFAAVIVARKLKLPWISSVLAPISFMSAHDPPVLPPAPWLVKLRIFGPGPLGAIFALGRKRALRWVRPVLDLANELGTETKGNPVFEGSHSPSLVLALYSELLAAPQPDWPPNVVVTGFPFYDSGPESDLAPELAAFVADGPAPIVFTLGSSAVGAAGAFYRDSLQCMVRLGGRAVFLTGSHAHGLPDALPAGFLAWPYASHSQLFPRASAIVHQGGIGTTAQAMRSGRPMLVVPFAHDQFDNAERVRRLGAGEVLHRSRYSANRAERVLRRLLNEPAYASAASRVSKRIRQENGAATAVDAIERLRVATPV
jgi:rhamnosyltransferase subunit B